MLFDEPFGGFRGRGTYRTNGIRGSSGTPSGPQRWPELCSRRRWAAGAQEEQVQERVQAVCRHRRRVGPCFAREGLRTSIDAAFCWMPRSAAGLRRPCQKSIRSRCGCTTESWLTSGRHCRTLTSAMQWRCRCVEGAHLISGFPKRLRRRPQRARQLILRPTFAFQPNLAALSPKPRDAARLELRGGHWPGNV